MDEEPGRRLAGPSHLVRRWSLCYDVRRSFAESNPQAESKATLAGGARPAILTLRILAQLGLSG